MGKDRSNNFINSIPVELSVNDIRERHSVAYPEILEIVI